MRILIATDAFPPKSGGSGWSTLALARALLARGHAVEIVQPVQGTRGLRTRRFEDVELTEFGFPATGLPGVRAWQRSRRLDGEFAAFLAERARKADVIHAQHLLTVPPSVRAGRAAGVPVVSTVRDYWPVCLYGTLWRSEAACPICRGSERARCLEQRYGSLARLSYPFLPLVERELLRRQRALNDSHAVIAVSHFVADRLAGVVEPGKLLVVPNLVEIDRLRAEAAGVPPAASEPYLVFIGKLNRAKGADWLPAILRRANLPLKLVVVGDGELSGQLSESPNLELRGWLSNREALGLLARARALLLPSRWPEPLARVLLEAQALGVPAVACDTGGTRDIIRHEVNGLLASDLDGFAAQVARVALDDALCARLAAGAQRAAEAQFSAQVVGAQLEAIYAGLQGFKQPCELHS